MEPNYSFDDMAGMDDPKEEDIKLGKAISYWIEQHGSLNLSTPKDVILKFYDERDEEEPVN